jgi:RNA polymerase sigma factor (sigma-70 family)
MNADGLETLLERLRNGDPDAAEQLIRAYEPYLRMVVRRQLSPSLRRKFDSIDVVQSMWADVLDGFRGGDWNFSNPEQLRGFLAKAARNRFIDRSRQQRRSLELEFPLGESGDEVAAPTAIKPSQEVQASDLWQQMLALCPPDHHELLELKRQGFSLDEIAERTGLHKSSVRRILYDLARRLAQKRKSAVGAADGER